MAVSPPGGERFLPRPVAPELAALDPRRTAVVVVDMQNDFCRDQGFYSRVGRDGAQLAVAIRPIQRLLDAARAAGMTVVYTRLVYDLSLPDLIGRHRLVPAAWAARERRLAPGTWGAAIVDELEPRRGELVIDKSDYSAFYGTNLEQVLRRRGVQAVILAGTTTHACVLHTAFDAFVRDFDVVVAAEAVSCWFDDLHDASLRIVELLLGHVVPLDGLVALIERQRVGAEGQHPEGPRVERPRA
jgi:ureidoacrylate peracid hydrolase